MKHVCTYCDKGFATPSKLNIHLNRKKPCSDAAKNGQNFLVTSNDGQKKLATTKNGQKKLAMSEEYVPIRLFLDS